MTLEIRIHINHLNIAPTTNTHTHIQTNKTKAKKIPYYIMKYIQKSNTYPNVSIL